MITFNVLRKHISLYISLNFQITKKNILKTKNNFIARVKPTKFPYENEIFGVGEITTVKKTDFGPAHVLRTNTKPPLAGPYAFSRIPKSKWKRQRVLLTHEIRDTWLFSDIYSG